MNSKIKLLNYIMFLLKFLFNFIKIKNYKLFLYTNQIEPTSRAIKNWLCIQREINKLFIIKL